MKSCRWQDAHLKTPRWGNQICTASWDTCVLLLYCGHETSLWFLIAWWKRILYLNKASLFGCTVNRWTSRAALLLSFWHSRCSSSLLPCAFTVVTTVFVLPNWLTYCNFFFVVFYFMNASFFWNGKVWSVMIRHMIKLCLKYVWQTV